MEIPLLSNGESKVYKALVEIGETTIGNILKHSKVSHSKIYDILKRLADKGLVSIHIRNGKQHFSAANPLNLSHLLDDEETKLEKSREEMSKVISKLKDSQNITAIISPLSAYEGIKGMKVVLEGILDEISKRDTICILGSPKEVSSHIGGYIKDWQKRRIEKKAKCKIITDSNSDSWDDLWWKKSKDNKLTFTKKSKSISPTYLIITPKSVVTIYFAKKILSICVKQEDIAIKHFEFFDTIWNASK